MNATHTFPAAVLAAIPLDDRHAAPNQLARPFAGTDDRIFAFDATRGRWWHVPNPALFQALGFAWDAITVADAAFVPRLAPERAAPFPQLIGQTAAATAYEVPADRLVLQRHDRAAPAVVIGIGWIAADGASMVPVGFVRDAALGQTYAVVRREVDGLIVRYWIAPTDPLVQAVPWERVTTQYTLPAAVLATIPLDERDPQANQLARRFDGTDDRIVAYDARQQQWRPLAGGTGFRGQHVTAADAAFFERVATGLAVPQPRLPAAAGRTGCGRVLPATRTSPLPRLIGRTATASAYELPGDRALLHLHTSAAASVVLGIGWIAADGASMVPVGFVRDAALGQTYAVVRREVDGLIVRYWIAPTDPLVQAVPWERVTTQYTLPAAVLATIPLDERDPQANQLARRFDGTDDRIVAYDAELGQWVHVPDLATFQARGYYWCDVTGADAAFFDRINQGLPYPVSSAPAQPDYPSCRP